MGKGDKEEEGDKEERNEKRGGRWREEQNEEQGEGSENDLPRLVKDFANAIEHDRIFGRAQIHSEEPLEKVLKGNDEVKQIIADEAARQPIFLYFVRSLLVLVTSGRVHVPS